MQMQFRLVDAITRHFNGSALLTQGDLGVVLGGWARLVLPDRLRRLLQICLMHQPVY